MPFWAITVLGLLLVYLTWWYNRFHLLDRVPGPLWARFTRIPYWVACLSGNEVYFMKSLHEKYGTAVRFSPEEVSFIDDQAWKDLCGHQKGKPENFKAPFFHLESVAGKDAVIPSLVSNNTADHARIRRLFSPGFSERALKQQQPLFQKYADLLIQKLHESGNEPLDILKMFNYTTFDIMGELTFGKSLGQLQSGEYSAWVQSVILSIKALPVIQLIAYYPLLRGCFALLEPKKIREYRLAAARYPAEQVDKRMERASDQPDLWNLIESAGDEERLSRQEMHANGRFFMLAGTETTGTLLTALTYLLLTNPEKLRKLQHEVRSQAKSITGLSLESLAGMKYLNACIHEALRLYPPVPIGIPRLVTTPQTVSTHFLPAGTRASIHHYAAYRSSLHFPDRPESFVPERWLEGAARAEVFQPFSYGPRNCLGQNMAWHEMRLLAAAVVAQCELELCAQGQGWMPGRVFVLWEKKPLMVKVKAAVRG